MGDIAAILGVSATSSSSLEGPPPPAPSAAPRAVKLQGLPKEVTDLMGARRGGATAANELPMAVPASTYAASASLDKQRPGGGDTVVKVGNKWISAAKPARKWVWAPFSSSARTDGLLLHHWVRNVEYPDYPYARFDIHLDPVTYHNDEEYRNHLQDPDWTKGETDQLLQLAKRFELRWPVIYDRWIEIFNYGNLASDVETPRHRKMEDLQHRFYSVSSTILQLRIKHEAANEAQSLASQTAAAAAAAVTAEAGSSMDDSRRTTDALLIETAAARALASAELPHQPVMRHLGTGTANKVAFDLNYERERRAHMEALWNRTKEEEQEEAELRKELKVVEAQLRKLKKSGAHVAAAGGSASAASSRNASRAGTPVQFGMLGNGIGGVGAMISTAADATALLNPAFAASIPTAVAGTPYLQSARLVPPATGGATGINKALRTRMDEVLDEMNVKEQLVATKRVCDLYDTVRKDILTLLILQRTAMQKEGLLASKRLQLAKSGGSAKVVDEETLLGVQTISPSAAAQATASGAAAAAARGAATSNSVSSGHNPGLKIARSGSKLGKSSGGGGGGGASTTSSKSKSSSKPKTTATATAGDVPMLGFDASLASVSFASQGPVGAAVTSTLSGVKQARKPTAPGAKRKRPAATGQKSPLNVQRQASTASGAAAAATGSVDTFARALSVSTNPSVPTTGVGVNAEPMMGGHTPTTTATATNATDPSAGSDGKGKKRAKKSAP